MTSGKPLCDRCGTQIPSRVPHMLGFQIELCETCQDALIDWLAFRKQAMIDAGIMRPDGTMAYDDPA